MQQMRRYLWMRTPGKLHLQEADLSLLADHGTRPATVSDNCLVLAERLPKPR